ncbi:MAG: hypothetical protein ACYDCH_13980 [Gaiellaceae bacterium]
MLPAALGLVVPLLAVVVLLVRWRRPQQLLAEAAVHEPPTVSGDVDALAALDALLAELERTTVELAGADELDETSVEELEGLAERLERIGEALQPAFAHGDDVEAHL